MGLISRVSSRTYRGCTEETGSINPTMFISRLRPLQYSLSRKAGESTFRGTLPQFVADGYLAHLEVKGLIQALTAVTVFNYWIWQTSAKDPRYYFGSDQKKNYWKKYMSSKMWEDEIGFGIRAFNVKQWIYGQRGDPCFPSHELFVDKLGFKQPWRRDLYKLIVEVESANPADYPLKDE